MSGRRREVRGLPTSPPALDRVSMTVDIHQRILESIAAAGLKAPKLILEKVDSFDGDGDHPDPPLTEFLSEEFFEQMSINGVAWNWRVRTEVPRSYVSPLLDAMVARRRAATRVREGVAESLEYIPHTKLARYGSLACLDGLQWRAYYLPVMALVEEERAQLKAVLLGEHFEDSTRRRSRFAEALLQWAARHGLAGDRVQTRAKDVFRVPIGIWRGHRWTGEIQVTHSVRKTCVDMLVVSNHSDSGSIQCCLSLDLFVEPYGQLYMRHQERLGDALINAVFGLAVFRGMGLAIPGERALV